jgi:hypothetical protein
VIRASPTDLKTPGLSGLDARNVSVSSSDEVMPSTRNAWLNAISSGSPSVDTMRSSVASPTSCVWAVRFNVLSVTLSRKGALCWASRETLLAASSSSARDTTTRVSPSAGMSCL